MSTSRRQFLKTIPKVMAGLSLPFSLGGLPVQAMADNAFTRMAKSNIGNDRVLIILQMHGGNDGLNTLIPITDYEIYYSRRANIAIPIKNSSRKLIPLDGTLPNQQQVGLHPDMTHLKSMYDRGLVTVVQGVSYKNNNGSHFRGRDIWFMGGSADEYLESGWMGRYFQQEINPLSYPEDFPNDNMKDPLALEIGSDVSLIFHQKGNIPTSISLDNGVQEFADLIEELEGFQDEEIDRRGVPPQFLQNSPYYKELEWILSLEDKSKDYAARLAQVYQAGNSVPGFENYPTSYPFNAPTGSKMNPLREQLQLVAKLLSGGCKTKVFLVKIGGFDTHADQVESYDPTMGGHAALLYHISSAMDAFQKDLKIRGLEDRVLTITTSEFGRRIHSNGSYGTDHGTGGPMFIFGRYADPGVIGDVPNLTVSNVGMQYDYRQIYGNIVKNWFEVSDDRLNEIFPGLTSTQGTTDGVTFLEMPLVSSIISSNEEFHSSRFYLKDCYPNPARTSTNIQFRINSTSYVTLDMFTLEGKLVRKIVSGVLSAGEHRCEISLAGVPGGQYILQLKTGSQRATKPLAVLNSSF